MIYLGKDNLAKSNVLSEYVKASGVRKVFILSPEKFRFDYAGEAVEWVGWADIIKYRFFYRLLQEIGNDVLVVVNECLRTQNRYDLTYNCIRNFLNQTRHVIIFQYLPIIESIEDFMILFDFDTRSRWRRERFNAQLLDEVNISCTPRPVSFRRINIGASEKLRAVYTRERQKLFDSIGLKDPHTIPRNLHLVAGREKLHYIEQYMDPDQNYVGRNNRFNIPTMHGYKDPSFASGCAVFEFCHNIIDFSDFISLSQQSAVDVLIAEVKADQWYYERFYNWTQSLSNAYTAIP